SLARRSQRKLSRMGVEVRTGTPVSEIDENGAVVGGERIPAKTVIWTDGVQASPAGQWQGAEVDRAGRIKVLPDLTIPGSRNRFVALFQWAWTYFTYARGARLITFDSKSS